MIVPPRRRKLRLPKPTFKLIASKNVTGFSIIQEDGETVEIQFANEQVIQSFFGEFQLVRFFFFFFNTACSIDGQTNITSYY